MALIKSVRGFTPKIGKDCFIAENATLVGDVTMGDECSIWFSTVLRGDVNTITIGDRVNIQDGSVLHTLYQKSVIEIGNDVSVGHNVTIHGAKVCDYALIGMGSVLLDGVEVGEGAIVAAGSVVSPGTKIGAHELWMGVPAKFKKMVEDGSMSQAKFEEYDKDSAADLPDRVTKKTGKKSAPKPGKVQKYRKGAW